MKSTIVFVNKLPLEKTFLF